MEKLKKTDIEPFKFKTLRSFDFESMFRSEVVPCGNGAVVKAFKMFEGKKVWVLVEK
jgi:putative transposon-encoded protein